MKKVLMFLFCSFLFASYVTVPNTIYQGSHTIVDARKLDQNFSAITSGLSAGTLDINLSRIYLNGILTIDQNRNLYLNNATITGNLTVTGIQNFSNISIVSENVRSSSILNLIASNSIMNTLNVNYLFVSSPVNLLTVNTILVNTINSTARYTDKTGFVMPVGSIMPYAGSNAPNGWLSCNGQSVLKSDYSELYSAISVNWGSADSTHFNLPDLRGYFLRGIDTTLTRDVDYASRNALYAGGSVSSNVGSYEQDQVITHNHNTVINGTGGSGGGASGIYDNLTAPVNTPHTYTSANFGGSETRPKNAYVLYIIKY